MQHSKSIIMTTALKKTKMRLIPICLFLLAIEFNLLAQTTIIITDPPYNAICDGTSDDVLAVQLAINALNNGDTLIIPGPTGIGAPGLSVNGKMNITIKGSGTNAGFYALTGNYAHISGLTLSRTMLRIINSDSVVVKDLLFEGNENDFIPVCFGNTEYCEILSCEVRHTRGNGSWPAHAALAGISSINSRHLKVADNYVHDLFGDTPTEGPRGIWLGGVAPAENDNFVVVSNNIVENTNMTGITVHGPNYLLFDNYIYNTGGAGIKIEVSVDDTTGLIHVFNNTLVKHFFHGVQLGISAPNVVLRNVVIENNYIDSIQNSGVRVFAYVVNLTVRDNIIMNTALKNCINGYNFGEGGIYVTGQLKNASFTGNIISSGNNSGSCGQGIGLDNFDPPFNFAQIQNIDIRENEISKIKYHGIRIRTSSNSQPMDSIFIECNTFDIIDIAALQIENGGSNVGFVSWCWNTIGMVPDTFNLIGYNTNNLYSSCLPCDTLTNLTEIKNSEMNIKVYPNPVRDKLFISNLNKPFEYAIVDIYGRSILGGRNSDFISVNSLTNGIYTIVIRAENVQKSFRFIKH